MPDKFDEFSKHLATKHSRRGALGFLGAGVIGAFASALFSRGAAAGPGDLKDHFQFGDGKPELNSIKPLLNSLKPELNSTQPKNPFLNGTLPPGSDKAQPILKKVFAFLKG
jgi:hypothetical protein